MSISQETLLLDFCGRLRERLEGQLREGERLLWVGRPNALRMAGSEALRTAVANLILLFVAAAMWAIGWLWMAANPGVPVSPWIWRIACGAPGLAAVLICMRMLWAYRRARRTMYAVTDRRAIECRDLLFSPGCCHERAEVELVRARTWRGGRGEILFEPRRNDGRSSWRPQESVRFEYLDDVAGARSAVEQMLGREIPEENFGRDVGEVSPPMDLPGGDDLPGALRQRLHAELAESESVLWIGRPRVRVMMLRAAIPLGCMFLVALTCAGMFAVVAGLVTRIVPDGDWNRWVRSAPWIVAAIAAVVALAAMLAIASAAYSSRRSAYVITDRRALLVQVGLGARVYSYGRTALHELQVRELEDGSGEIIFEEKVRITHSESGSEERHTYVVGFIEVCPVQPARQALEQMLGRPVPALKVQSVSLNQYHPI